MRKGLLTELIDVFDHAKGRHRPAAEVNALRDEVIALLREGDRLRRRAAAGHWALQARPEDADDPESA